MYYYAKCSFCIAQMANTYPDRKKNPIKNDMYETYIRVNTEKEADYVNTINDHMEAAYRALQNLIFHISIEKL